MIELALLLEVAAHAMTAILATWLGLLVITRAGSARGSRLFALICGLLVVWSVSIIVRLLTADNGDVAATANLTEEAAAYLLPAAIVHIALVIAFEGRHPRPARAVLVAAYALGAAAIVQATIDPTHPISFDIEPNFQPLGVDGQVVAWTFALLRAGLFAASIGYLSLALGRAGEDRVRRRQLVAAMATILIGSIGGMARILPAEIGGPRWVGVSMVAAATVLAAYAVVAQHLFLSTEAAVRAVRWSSVSGIGLALFVLGVVLADRWFADAVSVDLPIVSALALIVVIALVEPVGTRVRSHFARGSPSAHAQLLSALGDDALLAQPPDKVTVPVLERVIRSFRLEGASVIDPAGRFLVAVGADPTPTTSRVQVPLQEALGAVEYRTEAGRRLSDGEVAGLHLAAAFIGSSLRLARRQEEQAEALTELRADRAALASRGSALQTVLADATDAEARLQVFALGPLRAKRNGVPIRRWGGAKAGSRQAEAIFAMLFDRGESGVSKDEIVDVVWPDVDLDRADAAFHRTLLGLRSVLSPARRRGREDEPITFGNDRYRLEPSVVGWTDVHEFERLIGLPGAADDAISALERACALYRGDYLDDVPYLGDHAVIEDRRRQLRRAFADALRELADRYAARGEDLAAAASRRRAEAVEASASRYDEDSPLTMRG